MTEPTLCEDCDNLEPSSAKLPTHRWLCMKAPNLGAHGFLSRKLSVDAPYMRCAGINGGKCGMFTPKRTNQINLNIEEK